MGISPTGATVEGRPSPPAIQTEAPAITIQRPHA